MDKLVIRGGNALLGTVRISGAKNAALPCMAAALLTDEPVILENIPQVRDIETTRKLLAAMGAEVELGYGRAHHRTTICARTLASPEASYELVKTMRASTLVLGPLVARCGRAHVSLPGGCAIGARPIDLHIKGLERLGAKITQEHGYVEADHGSAQRGSASGRRNCFRQDYRHRHRRHAHGRHACRGRNHHAELRPRTGSRRPGRAAQRHGRQNPGRGHVHDSRQGRQQAPRRQAPHHPRPHRGRNLHHRRRPHRRRPQRCRMQSRAPHRHPAEARGNRREDCGEGRLRPRHGRSAAPSRRPEHGRISGLPHRHAGAIHGAGHAGRRALRLSRKIFSKTASCTRRNWCAWAPISRSKDAVPSSAAELR